MHNKVSTGSSAGAPPLAVVALLPLSSLSAPTAAPVGVAAASETPTPAASPSSALGSPASACED